tara:strand:- start:1972 stop:2367 length:396 start_codon:yes stop_codon:yes gene_type:complete
MSNLSYTFTEGQIVELFHGVPHDAWTIYSAPDDVIIRALQWNDSNGDFEGLERVRLLEIFLSDFIVSKSKPAAKNEYITKMETVNTGGNCMVDFAHLWNGRVIGVNSDGIVLYDSMESFFDGDEGLIFYTA